MPVITEEGFDILQESTVVVDSDSAPKTEEEAKISEVGNEQSEGNDPSEPARVVEGSSAMPIVSAKGDNDDLDDDDDEDLDETLAERLWGLTEMFPESLRSLTYNIADASQSLLKASYGFGCNATWVLASSATILVLPVMFELERAQMEQQQLQQQRQILLGPNAAASGPGGMPPMPSR